MKPIKRGSKILLPAAVLLCCIALWEGLVALFQIPSYTLPSPSRILSALITDAGTLCYHALVSLEEAAIGLVIAAVLAVILAILMDRFPHFKSSIYPILVVTQTVPVIVLAPLFIIYMGFGMLPKIVTVVMMCFFPIVVPFADAMGQTNTDQLNLLKSFGAGTLKQYRMVKIPSALPSLFSGLKVAATYCISGAVVGEWISSKAGLGYYMLRVKNSGQLQKVFASVVVVILLSLAMNGLVGLLRYICTPGERKQNSWRKRI